MFFSGRDEKISVTVGGLEYKVVRARLQRFLLLEQLRSEHNVGEYLEECGIPTDGPGLELLVAYNILIRFNSPKVSLPMLTIKDQRKQGETPWDYMNRHIVFWVYMLASRAHLSISEIKELNIDDFFALLQETLTDEQLEKEWTYTLSEIAYQYDPASKTSRFKPLERPSWMMKIRSKHTPRSIPADMMPKGVVISISPDASKLLDS